MYDQETGLYYLQSRYYSPKLCRFISADSVSYLGADGTPVSYNLFAYCGNNPVMYSDSSGHMPEWLKTGLFVIAGAAVIAGVAALTVATGGMATPVLVGAALGGFAGFASSIAMQTLSTGTIDISQLLIDTTVGGVMGAFGGSAVSQLGMTIAGSGTGFISSVADNWVHSETIDVGAAFKNALMCAMFAYGSGPAKQFATKGYSAAIKGTLGKIAQGTGSWKNGLTKIYSNKLSAISNNAIYQIVFGFGDDLKNNCIQYFYALNF